jgi:hypothetical protein
MNIRTPRGTNGRLSNAILPAQRAFPIIGSRAHPPAPQWIQVKQPSPNEPKGQEATGWGTVTGWTMGVSRTRSPIVVSDE